MKFQLLTIIMIYIIINGLADSIEDGNPKLLELLTRYLSLVGYSTNMDSLFL